MNRSETLIELGSRISQMKRSDKLAELAFYMALALQTYYGADASQEHSNTIAGGGFWKLPTLDEIRDMEE